MVSEHQERIMFIKENCNLKYHDSVKLLALSESDGLQISDKVVSQLYKFTLEKYHDVDFGTIPNSKGMITNLPEYKNITAGIELLRSLEIQSNEGKIEQIDTLEMALKNVEKYSKEFSLAYKMDKSLGIMLYEIITMAIIRCTSYMMGNAIMYVKDPTIKSFKSLFDGKEEDILIRNLKKFNLSVQKGEIAKLFDNILIRKEMVTASTLATMGIVIAILLFIIPALRELVYFYYNSRITIRDFIRLQADTLKNNIYALKYNSKVNKKVIQKQEETLEKLNDIANKLTIDGEVASKKTDVMIKNEKANIENIEPSTDNSQDMGLL
jgi:hypothetical protein